jgi:hypothetical protein
MIKSGQLHPSLQMFTIKNVTVVTIPEGKKPKHCDTWRVNI